MSIPEHSESPQPLGLAVDGGVGRLEPERAIYACACKSRDAGECHRRRYGIVAGDVSHGAEECDCGCHWTEDDE